MPDQNGSLPDDIYAEVERLSARGNELLDAADYEGAIEAWNAALALVAEPKAFWDAAMWLHASIGGAAYQAGDDNAALAAFVEASRSADGGRNPYVQMNLGVLLLDAGREEQAVPHLLQAYMAEGYDIFANFGLQYLDPLLRRGLVAKN